jgi:hypothetical protein
MKPNRFTSKKIARAVQTAHNNDSISSEVYDQLVQAGVEDMRLEQTWGWTDTIVVDNENAPPADEAEFTWSSGSGEGMPKTPGTEAEDGNAVKATAESRFKDGTGEAPPGAEDGYGFVWCLDCGRLDRIKFESRTLPKYFEGGEGEQKCGIVLILCGLCRRTAARVTVAKNQLESRMMSSFNQLGLGAQVFEGSEAVRAAREVMQREVQVLTNSFGVAYRDVDKIVQELGVEDQMSSVDLDKFRKRGGQGIVLPYVRGGLISGQTG